MSCTPVRSWPEWVILMLGLAGIPAIWLAFAWGTSPIEALRLFSDQVIYQWRLVSSAAGDASDLRDTAVTLAALLPFFLAPFVSLAQLSRCLGRPCFVWQKRLCWLLTSVAIAGCLAFVGLMAWELAEYHRGQEYLRPPDTFAVLVAFGIIVGALVLWFRVFRRRQEDSAERLMMSAYISGVGMWAASFADLLEPTAVAAGFTCVVYAVSLWRRLRQADAAG